MHGDVDSPMSNVELRLTFADIKSEVAEIKRIGIDTHTQAKKTNGRVNWHDKLFWTSFGALGLLTPWMMWVTTSLLKPATDSLSRQDVQAAVEAALDQYEK